jgi:hypothetical protein
MESQRTYCAVRNREDNASFPVSKMHTAAQKKGGMNHEGRGQWKLLNMVSVYTCTYVYELYMCVYVRRLIESTQSRNLPQFNRFIVLCFNVPHNN